MKCYKCGSSIEKNVSFYPVQPKGTKNRKWACEECLHSIPERKRKKLLKAGSRRSLKLFFIIKKNQIIDILS